MHWKKLSNLQEDVAISDVSFDVLKQYRAWDSFWVKQAGACGRSCGCIWTILNTGMQVFYSTYVVFGIAIWGPSYKAWAVWNTII